MNVPIAEAVAIAAQTANLANTVAKLAKAVDTAKIDGLRNLLVDELEHNERCLDMIYKRELTLEKGVDLLSTNVFHKVRASAADKKMDKRKLGLFRAKKIKQSAGIKDKAVKTWIGKPAKELLKNIYVKISDLKDRYPNTKDNPKYRWRVRAKNCRNKCTLLIRHYDH